MKFLQKYFYLTLTLCLFCFHAQADKLVDRWLAANAVGAPSYVLVDMDSGRILAQKNMHERREPASTTKILTALLALESEHVDQPYTIGPNPPKTRESSMYLEQGEVFTLRQLAQAALVQSANDSCVAIAEAVAGNVPAFVQRMNVKAKLMGAKNTHFANPHGLHDPDHYTTAYDLSLIARAALKNPAFDATVRLRKLMLHGNAHIPQRIFYNHNKLLQHWDKCDGVKTGYTRQAGRCLVATATETDPATGRQWRLLSVVMHSANSWSDSINLLQRQGFDRYQPVRMAKAGEVHAQVAIREGGTLQAIAEKDLWLPLLNGDKTALQESIHPLERTAPIEKGQIIAYISWNKNGQKIAAMPLVAKESMDKDLVHRVMDGLQGDGPIYRSKWVWVALALLALYTFFRVNTKKRRRKRR